MRGIPAGLDLTEAPAISATQFPLGEWLSASPHLRAGMVRQAVTDAGSRTTPEACLALYGLLPETSEHTLDRKTLEADFMFAVGLAAPASAAPYLGELPE